MEIENLIRYTSLAVGLKPSAIQGEARLRGLERIIYSKTIISAWVETGRPCSHRGAMPGSAGLRRAERRGRPRMHKGAVPGSARLWRACRQGRLRMHKRAVPGCARLRRAEKRGRPCIRMRLRRAERRERPDTPFLTGVDFLASPCVPSPVSAIRTPKLPLLPVWVERGGI